MLTIESFDKKELDKVIKKVGEKELNNIINEINSNCLFENDYLIISKEYVCDKYHPELCKKILDIKRVEKFFGGNNHQFYLVIDGETYARSINDTHEINKIIRMIQFLNQNVRIGYYTFQSKIFDLNTLNKDVFKFHYENNKIVMDNSFVKKQKEKDRKALLLVFVIGLLLIAAFFAYVIYKAGHPEI